MQQAQVSDEIIKVLDYLGGKMGVAIDWTSENVLPYISEIIEKFIKWEIETSIFWIILAAAMIGISLIAGIVGSLAFSENFFWFVFVCVLVVGIIVIGCQAYDIVTCQTFPEKAVYDYLKTNGYLN